MRKLVYCFFVLFLGLSACSTNTQINKSFNLSAGDSIVVDYNDSILISIRYDFKNLSLSLNDKKIDTFWRWSHMDSPNPMPDTTTFERYMNTGQLLFSFDGHESLPALYIQTYKNNIIHFTAGTILDLPDNSKETLNRVFDSLVHYELLNDRAIRNQLITKGYYLKSDENIEEYLQLRMYNYSGFSHGSLVYGIQLKSRYNRSFKYYLKD